MKSERSEIKLEDNQLDVKCSIDDMVVSKSLLYYIATIDRLQRNHNKLENKERVETKAVREDGGMLYAP